MNESDIAQVEQNQPNLEQIAEDIQTLQPFDIAESISGFERQDQLRLITLLPEDLAAEALEYLEPEMQYRILHHLDDDRTARLLKAMSSDTIVDMLLAIHPLQAKKLNAMLPEDYRNKLHELMTFPENTAGSLATVDYIAARKTWTIEYTIGHIRKVGREAEVVSYIYVVGPHGELVGVVSLKEVILADPGTALAEMLSREPIVVDAEMEPEKVADILSRYDLVALPVVNKQNRLIGIVTVDDLMDVMQEEATEDFQKFGGSTPLTNSYFKTTVWGIYGTRIVWLLILFVGGAFTTTVLDHFQAILSTILVLSLFIPLLTGTGGNIGSQIISTMVRGLGVGEVRFEDLLRVLLREIWIGACLGVTLGFLGFAGSLLFGVQARIALVVGLSALMIVLWSSIVSSVLPLLLHRLKIDPAVVSGPLISTLVDGTGLIIYFTIAQWVLGI